MNKNYKETLLHNIYAIIEPEVDVVYVGKTTIKNPHKKRNDVLNGKISSIDGEFSDSCKFLLLESIYASKPDAFRHVLAWYRFFEDNGFDVLAFKKAANMLEFSKHITKKIYNEVCLPYSIEEVLERKILPLNEVEETEYTQAERYPFTQLNIRVRENIADSFRSVSRKFGLSQNDTLKLLLSEKDDKMKANIADKICVLEQEINNYKERLKQKSKQSKEDKNNALRKYKEKIQVLENSINLLVQFFVDEPKEEIHKQQFKEEHGKELFHSYPYPETSRCCLATLEEVVIGNYHTSELEKVTATKFLLFNTLSNGKIKLRLFGQHGFVGRYPISCAYKNSLWIVGYTISNDGGANMVLGIPVDSICADSTEDEKILFEEKCYGSVEDLISFAEDIKINNY